MAFEKERINEDGIRDDSRVVIIDYNHLAYKYLFGASPLSVRLDVGNGLTKVVDTTIPAYTIKDIVYSSSTGRDYVVVCMDSPIQSRKEAFRMESDKYEFGKDYKETRKDNRGRMSALFDGINLTGQLLRQAGVTVLQQVNYEADDLVLAAIVKAKQEFPNHPIDVITGDLDLLPLTDEQVSVYIVSRKETYNSEHGQRRTKYFQSTPESYERFIGSTSAFKNRVVPYNTLLLWKILRGDDSDNIEPVKEYNKNGKLVNRWKPKDLEEMTMMLQQFDLITPQTWGYSPHKTYIRNTQTGELLNEQEALIKMRNGEIPKEHLELKIGETENYEERVGCLDKLIEMGVMDEFDKEFVLNRYSIMNLNGAFFDTPTKRPPFIMTETPTRIDTQKLQQVVEYLQITIPQN